MEYGQPEGRITENTMEGNSCTVGEWDRNDYILINPEVHWADEPREYRNEDGEIIKLNQYNDVLDFLEKHSFC